MDIESVRLFVLAAEKLNISAAGRLLNLPPAVASARLAKLEHTLSTELLHRSTRKVSLSQDGEDFLPFAQEILAQEGAARAALGQTKTDIKGTLRFAASSSFAQLYIAPLLPEFLDLYPHINLDLRLSDTPFDLLEGSFDLALRNTVLTDTSLKCRKLADDKRILCASPSYLKKFGTPRTPEDLQNHKLLAFRDQSSKALLRDGKKAGYFDPQSSKCRLVIDDGISHKLATISGAGISMNSIWNAKPDIQQGSLIQILTDYDVDDASALWFVYPKSNILTAKVRVFMDFLLGKFNPTPPWNL